MAQLQFKMGLHGSLKDTGIKAGTVYVTTDEKAMYVDINDTTVIREFSYNYYVEPHEGCAWSEDERYCVLVKWDDFLKDMEYYIEQAFNKRSSPLVDKVRVNIKR